MAFKQYDWRDKLVLDASLLAALAGTPADPDRPEVEYRQCLVLNVAAGILTAREGRLPDSGEVQSLALALRQKLFDLVGDAERALGERPEQLTRAEDDLRAFVHNLVMHAHDRDYRTFVAFPVNALRDMSLVVTHVDYFGRANADEVVGMTYQGTPAAGSGCSSTGGTYGCCSHGTAARANGWRSKAPAGET